MQAKKTQRSKDWPVIEMLVAIHYRENASSPREDWIEFWLRDARTPELIAETRAEQARDREYWAPLRQELEAFRRERSAALRVELMAFFEGRRGWNGFLSEVGKALSKARGGPCSERTFLDFGARFSSAPACCFPSDTVIKTCHEH